MMENYLVRYSKIEEEDIIIKYHYVNEDMKIKYQKLFSDTLPTETDFISFLKKYSNGNT
tara:strand:+ start:870 stop:1046 length:177 start_codon:yes stop_codon:yes gene_type:complete